MPSPAIAPALALVIGALVGVNHPAAQPGLVWALPVVVAAAIPLWRVGWTGASIGATTIGFFIAGSVLAGHAAERALHTSIRSLLDDRYGGFSIETAGPGGSHDPIRIRGELTEDGAHIDDITALRVRLLAAHIDDTWIDVNGTVTLTVGGTRSTERVAAWKAGRTIEAPSVFRRPARYLDDGVDDFERDLALDGITLFGTVKSAYLVDVITRGNALQEASGWIRMAVRQRIQRWVAPHGARSAAIVAAVLIGDRAGLPEEVRTQLQTAGTYHVIAISGGNIAILAAAIAVGLMLLGIAGRPAALVTLILLLLYSQVVTAGASVWRATLMAALYLTARLVDHRTAAWHSMLLTAAVVICVSPLDVRDPAFALTFGATAALLEVGRRVGRIEWPHSSIKWLATSVAASAAVEAALLPVSAEFFSRVTLAGLGLNLLAVPLMAAVQMAGMAVVTVDRIPPLAALAGWTAHIAASLLVRSAALVELARWLTARVPPPDLVLVALYYTGLGLFLFSRRAARMGAPIVLLTGFAIYLGFNPRIFWSESPAHGRLRLTVFDVGQGDASLLQLPEGSTLMVDAGGVPFGGSFDIGGRVLAPAMWARGVRSLDALLLTHGDPDHIGGASAVIADFHPRAVWQGVPVVRHVPLQEVLTRARAQGVMVEERRWGEQFDMAGARIHVLHPPPPDWERQKVRNDDSVVIEVLYGNVAVLMTGDIEADVERELLPNLVPASIRVLKVAHHGSRTSSSREFLESWRPQFAIISCGRGNRFGHPAADVVGRLTAIGSTILRTDLDGEVTLETDGREIQVITKTP